MSLFTKAAKRQVLDLPVSDIRPNPRQPRRDFPPEELAELALSISQVGVLQPLSVRRTSSGWELIAGERRLRAAQLAGLTRVPCLPVEADSNASALLALVENLQRQDLTVWEEAAALRQLIDRHHLSQEEAAQRVGKSRSAVANALRLLGLQPAVRKLVEEGTLSAGHARTLLPLSPALQEKAAATVLQGQLSVRQTEALVKRLTAEPEEEEEPLPSREVDYAAEAQQSLSSKLGRGVKIVTGRKKGRIELEYYGLDDLNDLLEALALLRTHRKGPER